MDENRTDTRYLPLFLNLVYASILGLSLQKMYDTVSASLPAEEKFVTIWLFVHCVYIIVVDWLYSRGITERNPYPVDRYSRFTCDFFIAFLSYGVLFFASRRTSLFVVFIIAINFFSILWALCCKKDSPKTQDQPLLNLTVGGEALGVFLFSVFYLVLNFIRDCHLSGYMNCLAAQDLHYGSSIIFSVVLWLWLLIYEISKTMIENEKGAYFGPAASLISHKLIRRILIFIRTRISRAMRENQQ